MSEKAIASRVFGANVRSSPSFGDNVVGYLNQCDPVTAVGPQQGDRWIPCRAEVDGVERQVFISKNVLRDRVSPAKERLMRECVKQWLRFDRGRAQEHESPQFQFVGEFWQAVGLDLDGRDRDVPWSAAFISYCVATAGGYSGFKLAAAHSRFTHQAVRRRLAGVDGPFWGFRIDEHRPGLGDIVCKSRAGSGATFDLAADEDAFKSHTDIVVHLTDTHAVAIGGNVGHSVRRTPYRLDADGFLENTGKVFAVLRNNR